MSDIMFMILIVAFVQTLSVDGQSSFGSYEDNGTDFMAEMQNTILYEIRNVKNQVLICNDKCPNISDILAQHLTNITQTLQSLSSRVEAVDRNARNGSELCSGIKFKANSSEVEALLSRQLSNITQAFQSVNNRLNVLEQNVRNGSERSDGLGLKFQNLSMRYEEQVRILRAVERQLEEHDEYYRNQSVASTCPRQG